MRRAPVAHAIATSLCLFAATGARAADDAHGAVPDAMSDDKQTREPDAKTLDTLVVTGQREAYPGGQVSRTGSVGFLGERDIFETPFNVTNFTRETIDNLQAIRIEDVVRTDPSVRVANTGTSYYQDFTIRGFRVTGNATLFNGVAGIFPVYSQLLLQPIERIDVFKGANTLLAGVTTAGLSIGGTINLVPKRAEDAPTLQVGADFRQDAHYGVQADVGRRFADGRFGVRVNVYGATGDTAIDDERDRLGLFAAAFDYRGERFTTTLDIGRTLQYSRAAQTGLALDADLGVEVPRTPALGSNFQQPFTYSNTEYNYQLLRTDWQIVPNLTAYASVGASQLDYKQLLSFGLLRNVNGDLDEIFQNGSGKEYGHTLNAGFNAHATTGAVEHDVAVTGTRLTTDNYHFYAFDEAGGTQATVASNLYRPTRGVALRPDLYFMPRDLLPPGYSNVTSSLAIADTLSMFDRRVLLTLGSRRQRITGGGYDEHAWTPAVAALVKVGAHASLYANVIESLEGGPTAPDEAVNRGQVFPPSRDKQKEVGVKFDFGRFGLTTALYEIDQPSAILDPVTLMFSLNGRQANRGFELNLFGEPMTGLRLQGGLALTRAELEETQDGTYDGQDAIGVAPYNATLVAEWDVPRLAGVTLTGEAVRTGPVWLNLDNTRRIDAFTDVTLGARWSTRAGGRPLVLRGGLANAFGSNHWVADVYGSFYQAAPRTLTLSATYDF